MLKYGKNRLKIKAIFVREVIFLFKRGNVN